MPELPEITIISRVLRNGAPNIQPILDEVIESTQVLWQRTIASSDDKTFARQIAGQVINDIQRRGKYLIFHLSRDSLLFHLRMSGDLLIEEKGKPLTPHVRLVLDFISNRRIIFNDPRKFGRVWLVNDPQEVLSDLGPEPLDSEFTPQELFRILSSYRRQIKPLLMDQHILAGLGNIYTDEALHKARLHPLIASDQIDFTQTEILWKSIRDVLEEAIHRNGSSIDWVYRGGDYQNHFRVYQREGEPCPECGTVIERILVGQRGTHICPQCQKIPI